MHPKVAAVSAAPVRATRDRFGWIAPAAWTIYFILPIAGWAGAEGFPLRPAQTALLAAVWLAYFAWRPKWSAAVPLVLLAAKLTAGTFVFGDRGLVGSYFADADFTRLVTRRVDVALDFGPDARRFLPVRSVTAAARPFSVAWSGFLYVQHDETLTVFADGRDVSGSVAVDGASAVTLHTGSTDSRAEVSLRSGWRRIDVRLSSSGGGHTFYSGFIDASGLDRPFGDGNVYRRRVSAWPMTIDRIGHAFTRVLDVAVLAYLATVLGLALARSDLAAVEALTLALIAAGIAFMFVALPHGIGGDGRPRFDALAALLEHGRTSAYAYSLLGPLFSAPLFYLGALAYGPEWWCARYNAVLLAIGLGGLDWVLRNDLDRRRRWTFLLVIVAASMFPNHTRGYDAEVFTALCAAIGIAAVETGRVALGWTLLVGGVVNTPASLVGLLLVTLRRVWATRELRHILSVAAAVAFLMLESWWRRGGALVSGYAGNAGIPTVMPYSGLPGFSYPLLFGLLSIVLSFGKGLLFYAPGLTVPVGDDAPTRIRACQKTWMVYLAGLVLVYAKWWSWYGGWAWGPRFFLFASVPASLALAVARADAPRLRTWWLFGLGAVVALSAWVAVDGAVFDQSNLGVCLQNGMSQEFLCWYTPEFSALWRPFVAAAPLSAAERGFVAYVLLTFTWLSAPLAAEMIAGTRRWNAANAIASIRAVRF